MTREEAIRWTAYVQQSEPWQERVIEALDMAIEALKRERTDEWCTDCKEYDTEKKCCPRFNRVIRGAMKREPSEDGTLEVKVEDATKVGRVLISDDKHRGGLYYPDEDEPQGVSFENDTEIKSYSKDSDLISREAAKDIAFRSPFFSDALMEELDALPSADRPRTIEPTITVDLESGVVPISACEPKAPKTIIYADRIYSERPRGRWHYSDGKPATIGQSFGVICDQCGTESEYCTNFCGECGADMRTTGGGNDV